MKGLTYKEFVEAQREESERANRDKEIERGGEGEGEVVVIRQPW